MLKCTFTFLYTLFFLTACVSQDSLSTKTAVVTDADLLEIHYFLDLVDSQDETSIKDALVYIEENWKPDYEIMVIELIYFNFNSYIGAELLKILEKKTNQNFGYDMNGWYKWLWSKDPNSLQRYDYFKAKLHRRIDTRFEKYFLERETTSTIRFDEIRWGGVLQDGIPPLRDPEMISASEADYLEDHHTVFGIEVNGDFRAYPKRILAWHEMFTATVGDVPVTGVYCTLCGTVILYKSIHEGKKYNFGTSGFLFRSNKLMYDQETQSLWNTIWGKPVVGPLVGKGIELDYLSVVTTTWGEWKQLHPSTQVLSLNTGHRRDYGEGVAYRDYFSTDRLMFNVPSLTSTGIKNKQSILVVVLPEYPNNPLAISVKFLKKNPVYHHSIGNTRFVVLTDHTGANRVYESKEHTFTTYYQEKHYVTDEAGKQWKVFENRLEGENGATIRRINTYNAFWFGWQAAYPSTELIR